MLVKLTTDLKKKCLYGTLGAMMPHVAMLQETIWVPKNLLTQLRKAKPKNHQFSFTEDDWLVCGISRSKEAAIVYNSKKIES